MIKYSNYLEKMEHKNVSVFLMGKKHEHDTLLIFFLNRSIKTFLTLFDRYKKATISYYKSCDIKEVNTFHKLITVVCFSKLFPFFAWKKMLNVVAGFQDDVALIIGAWYHHIRGCNR